MGLGKLAIKLVVYAVASVIVGVLVVAAFTELLLSLELEPSLVLPSELQVSGDAASLTNLGALAAVGGTIVLFVRVYFL